jgi:cellular nucleic acid-binding protein
MSNTNIYVLLLEEGKYYIGKSNDILKRCIEHFEGSGSCWTKKYKPLKLQKTIENVSPFEEDKITKEYMLKYGIENVRGGTYTQIELTENQIQSINSELRGAMDECLKCGKKGHFIAECVYYKQNKKSHVVSYDDDDDDDDDDYEWVTDDDDHDDNDDSDNNNNSNSNDGIGHVCDKCGKTFKYDCYYYEHINVCKVGKVGKGDTCFRCGRKGHYAPNCYASSHIKGYYLH